MTETTDTAPATGPVLADPDELFKGGKLPTKAHTFTLRDGTELTVLLRGLPFIQKNEVDLWALERRDENRQSGITQADPWHPAILARAMCTPDGKAKYPQPEQWIPTAVKLAEQLLDGDLRRGTTAVLELSGYGKDAMEKAGKA